MENVNRRVNLKKDENYNLSLESNPSTGYDWHVIDNHDLDITLKPVELDKDLTCGAGVNYNIDIKKLENGTKNLKLEYKRSWEKEPASYVCEIEFVD